MWQSEKMRSPYAMRDIELTEPLAPIVLAPAQGGAHVLIRYRGRPVGRVWLSRAEHGACISAETLASLVAEAALGPTSTLVVRDALLRDTSTAPTPLLTIAVCSRNRPALLRRCLAALVAMRDARPERGPAVDILVVDNAPSDDRTRQATAEFPGVRYRLESIPGLDFARNHALANTERPWLAYIDDDAVVDRVWLESLAEAIAASPDAGCFCGSVLPLMLETEAQLRFERAGGFGSGFEWERYGPERWDDPVYPANAGRFGTGACMVLRTEALRNLGGFDDALDTGPPLPAGGDLDMFYRIVRAGYRLIYAPCVLVHHEHRRDMAGLVRQYYSWGQSVMVLLRKSGEADPGMRDRQRAWLLQWSRARLGAFLHSMLGRGPYPPHLILAEIGGAIAGYFGEYRRSQARIAARKREYGA